MNSKSAPMVEIFSSIQGEGIYIGVRQAFLRFHGCSLNCAYCDTRVTHETHPSDFCQVEITPGRKNFARLKNPVSLPDLTNILENWIRNSSIYHHSMSLTGGEPLLHTDVLLNWLPKLTSILPLYLETNGVMYNELSGCINYLKYISMDIKLPSVSGLQGFWGDHLNFLRVASQSNVFVKTIVSSATNYAEIQKTCDIITSVDRDIPLVIQPLNSEVLNRSFSPTLLLEFQELANRRLNNVRIIPQTHGLLGFL